jgi:chemotaxis protein methyltransferase CheR
VAVPLSTPSEGSPGQGLPEGAPELELERLEIELLLEAVYRRYGFDFRQYAQASLKRRLHRRMLAEGLDTISQLQSRLLHDPSCMEQLLVDLSINVTSMFRDPSFYVAFRKKIVPALHTYPFTRIWCAGCSSGEEVYSLAILLQEEGLYERTRLYATDINEHALATARAGVFPLDRMKQYTQNYIRAGGKQDFSEYYVAAYDNAQFSRALTENVVFAQHNLAMDRGFNEFNVIVCRNVLIYFDRALQDDVHGLFYESLGMFGILALGHKESIRFTAYADRYEEMDADERVYRKIA